MTQEAVLKEVIEKLGIHVEPNLDTAVADEYAAYFYRSEGTLWGDDRPCLDCRHWTLVYVAPVGHNRIPKRLGIRQEIMDRFGAWPEEEDASDVNGQRYIYTFDTIGGFENGSDGCVGV
jgi:hypothetical protein